MSWSLMSKANDTLKSLSMSFSIIIEKNYAHSTANENGR